MGRGIWEADRVPNAPLRKKVEELFSEDYGLSDICYSLGWLRKPTKAQPHQVAETSRLSRVLGLKPTKSRSKKTGELYVTHVGSISIETALAIAKAINVDFDELYEGLLPPQVPAAYCECGEPMVRPHESGLCGFCLEMQGEIAVAA